MLNNTAYDHLPLALDFKSDDASHLNQQKQSEDGCSHEYCTCSNIPVVVPIKRSSYGNKSVKYVAMCSECSANGVMELREFTRADFAIKYFENNCRVTTKGSDHHAK